MGDVGRHLSQVGEAVLACQLAVFQFQFLVEPRHFGAERFVRPLEPQRGGVPGGEHRVEVGILVRQGERGFVEIVGCTDIGFAMFGFGASDQC